VLTSQATGIWLRFVLSRGWPLLSSNPEETWEAVPQFGKLESPALATQEQRELPPSGIPTV